MSVSAEVNPRYQAPVMLDRRKDERVLTCLPIRIVSVEGSPASYSGVCTNLSCGGVGFETSARLAVGKVVEFAFVQPADDSVRFPIQILFRNDQHYGGCYVNADDR